MTTEAPVETQPVSEYQVTVAQQGFLSEVKRTARYMGGIGAGKSFVLTLWAVLQMLRGRVVLYIMPTYNMIEDIAIPLLMEHLEKLGIINDVAVTKKPPMASIGKGAIMFRSGESKDRIRGINAHDLAIDEAAYVPEATYLVALGRVRKSADGQIRMVGTPAGMGNWYSDLDNAVTYRQSTMANPFIPDEYKQDLLERFTGKYARQELYGEVVDLGGEMAFITPDLVHEAQNRIPVKTDEPITAGLDVARYGVDRSALVIRQGNQIIGVDVWEGQDLHVLRKKVMDQCVLHKVDFLMVDACGVGAGVHDELKEATKGLDTEVIEFNGAFKTELPGYANLRSSSWGAMKQWITTTGQLPKNEQWLKELVSVQYYYTVKNKILLESKEQMKRRGVHSPDLIDALSMTFYRPASAALQAKKRAAKRRARPYGAGVWAG